MKLSSIVISFIILLLNCNMLEARRRLVSQSNPVTTEYNQHIKETAVIISWLGLPALQHKKLEIKTQMTNKNGAVKGGSYGIKNNYEYTRWGTVCLFTPCIITGITLGWLFNKIR